jgi:hypothetical protein
MDKLEPELKDKWIAALRSGDYQQGRYVLKQFKSTNYQYCCLGVLCEITEGQNPSHQEESYDWLKQIMSIKTLEKLETFNDSLSNRKSFFEIADWIEENL